MGKIAREHFKKQKQKITKQLFFNNSNISIELVKLKINRFIKHQFMLLSPSFFADFTTDQLQKPLKLKNKSFRVGLHIGIFKLINKILENFQNNIAGLKIICSGKLKKTKSGRKQKLVIKIGRTRNSVLNNFIIFNEAN